MGERFAAAYGLDVAFDTEPINRNSIDDIISVLSRIVEDEENCVFDLTGGEDLVLVAMGIVFEKYRSTGKVQMNRFDIKNGTVYDCDSDGNLPDIELPKLTVRENVMLYGGTLVPYNGEKGTFDWNFENGFETDIRTMWEICKKNPGLWNSLTGTLKYMAQESCADTQRLEVYSSKVHIEELMKKDGRKFKWVKGIMQSFVRYGFIRDLVDTDDIAAFSFRDEQIKMCLTKEGNVLELISYIFLKELTAKDGSPKFNDIVNGAYIDWDSELHNENEEEKDTENEIDILLMKGMVPIFISCKNGSFDENELYKLNTVAERFGAPYAQKVLIASYYGKKNVMGNKYFVQRAKDMKIKLIQNVHELSDAQFINELRSKV